jgi:hypothetical protein
MMTSQLKAIDRAYKIQIKAQKIYRKESMMTSRARVAATTGGDTSYATSARRTTI